MGIDRYRYIFRERAVPSSPAKIDIDTEVDIDMDIDRYRYI